MAKRRGTLTSISPEQALQALSFLVHEGKLAIGTVEKALRHRDRIINEVRERLAALGVDPAGSLGKLAKDGPFPMAKSVRQGSPPSSPRALRRHPVSAAVKKARQAQGRYLGAIRQLSKQNRKKIKAIREKSGVDAAIAAANTLANSSEALTEDAGRETALKGTRGNN
jgi:hypothetical protein